MTDRTPNRAIVPTEIGGLYNEYGIDLVHVEDTGIDGDEIVTPIEWHPEDGDDFAPGKDDPVERAEDILKGMRYEVTGEWEYLDEYAVAPIAKKEGS